MTLTTAAKNWLATNAGVNNCFSSTGVSYMVWNQITQTFDTYVLGTGDVVSAFWASHSVNRDTDVIIAGMDYIGFKALNGGVNIGIADISFAYDNDGSGTLPAYCSPANVISATLTVDTNDCTTPCTVGGTVSWTNNGGTASVPMDLQVTVNGGTPTTVATGVIIDPGTTTMAYPFSLSDLVVGIYSICASPNSGTTCQTVNVTAPLTDAYFTSTPLGAFVYIDGSDTLSGVTPTTITGLTLGEHTYRLTYVGCYTEPTGTFTTVVGSTVDVSIIFDTGARFESTPSGASIYIDGGTTPSGVTPGNVTGLTPGEHTYTLKKSGYTDATGTFTAILCQRVNVPANLSRLQEAGMGIIAVGLLFGMLLMGKKKEKEKEK